MPQKTREQKAADRAAMEKEQFMEPGWDGAAANEYFCNAVPQYNEDDYHYETRKRKPVHLGDTKLALNHLYDECAVNAWTPEQLQTFLQGITDDSIQVPEFVTGVQTYKNSYTKAAKEILDKLNTKKYSFDLR